MKKVSVLLLLLVYCCMGYSQDDTVQARIILIGDAGEFEDGRQPVVNAVRQTIKLDKKTTVVYLGDNLYSTGLPDVQSTYYDIRRSVLDTQIAIADGTGAKVYFIPGNHDWNRGGKGGWDAVLREQAYIDSKSGKNVKFLPEGGCPGPVQVPLTPDVLLVIIDSHWWIHEDEKPGIESDCDYKTKLEVLVQLEDIMSKNMKKLVILAGHHPFKSYGIHGGFFKLKQHIFPFTDLKPNLYIPMPVIGSIYPITRGVFGMPEDLSHPAYEQMIKDITKYTAAHPNLIFVAGHEHNLQYIVDSNRHYIVSGSASKSTRVSNSKKTPFVSTENGFAVLNVSKKKNVDVSFYTVSDSIREAYQDHVLNFSRLPPPTFEDTVPIVYVPYGADSISVAANKSYDNASKVQRFFNGDNYRDVWAEPVKLKVFRLNKELGGLTITALGGGHQTRSLKLVDKNGKEYSLRSINKDLTKILPPGIKGTAAQKFLQDFISTAHPYAPLIIPPLAKAIDITVPKPRMFFVPNDPALGIYRPLFANTVVMLEEKEPVPAGVDTKSEQKVVNKLYEDNDHRVDQKAFLRARLLDFLVADWDRHFDQWRFTEYDTGKGKLYVPIPRDRDQAFTYSDGLLINYGSKNFLPFLKGFKKDIPGIKWLAYWAKDLDRSFLNKIDSSEWRKTTEAFTSALTDNVIDNAVRKLPPEVYKISGKELTAKLKSRRDVLTKEAMNYYEFLSKRVDIVGSNKHEYFKVESIGKNLQVRMYKKTKQTDSAALMYSRIFEPSVTNEISIYGLNGDDVFEIDPKANSSIKLRIIGGRGEDTFNIKGKVKNYLYDLNSEKNFIASRNKSRVRFEGDPVVNRYSQTGFQYDRYSFPNINLGYNPEDGLMAGVGFSLKTHGFRKDPYSTMQRLSTLYALRSGSYKFSYIGEFNQVFKQKDIVVTGEMGKPTLNNFFGIGNNTKVDRPDDREFYRVRYNYITGDVLVRKRVKSFLHLSAGATVFNYWNHPEDNQFKILQNPSIIGLDSANVYQTKTYLGGKAVMLIDNLRNELLPSRGINWRTQFTSMAGINNHSKPITTLTSDMSVYAALTDPAKVTAIVRVGGGHIFNDQYEYFQALNLGQNNFLRGFRKNRFSGKSLAYGSLSILYKLFDLKSHYIPGSVGLIAFDDIGRVWAANQSSQKWHNTYGGGLYFSPFNMVLISGAVGFSEEEMLFNISVGTKFNLTF